eukprot:14388928-Alexandrium_andersonii.AAC.1
MGGPAHPSGASRMATLTTSAPLHTVHAPCAVLARARPNTCSSGVRRLRWRGAPWASRVTSLMPSAL